MPGVKREVRLGERQESLEAIRTPFSSPSVQTKLLGVVYENPAFRNEGSLLVVDLAIAPVGLGGHLLEQAAAAECWLKAVE